MSAHCENQLVGMVGLEPTTTPFRFVNVSILPGLYHHPHHYKLGCRTLMMYYKGRFLYHLVSAPSNQVRDWLGSGLPLDSI